MSLLDRARLETRLGAYAVGGPGALRDAALLPRVQEARRLLSSRMVPLGLAELRERLPPGEVHVSRKVDGEFDVLVHDGEDTFLVNPGGTVRVGLPLLAEARARLLHAGVGRALVAGELHVVRPDGARARIHDVLRVAGRPHSPAELDQLSFAPFDILEPRVAATAEVMARLHALFGGGTRVVPVEGQTVKKLSDVEALFDRWVTQEGGEGVVLRSDAAGMFKVKPRHTLDVAVVGFTEGVDDRRGLLHDLLVALVRGDGTFHLLARVGGGFTESDRRSILSDLRDLAAASDYTEVGSDHLAYQMVRPEWVIEMSTLDAVTQTTRGAPIDKMVLSWSAALGKWEPVRRLPLAALISPNFVRRRGDKLPNATDCRIGQLTDRVDIPLADRDASRLHLQRSEVLRRAAWVKTLKGQKMVRKLLLWQTNKERDTEEYPAYVLYLTDFSPNRKTPLERDIRISNDRDQIEALWKELEAAYVVKGWVRADGAKT